MGNVVTALVAMMLSYLTTASIASASGAGPCSMFTSADGKLFNIGAAYSSADLVTIGKVVFDKGVVLDIGIKIKGTEERKRVSLTVPHCEGTACSGGFSVAPAVDLLFFLRRLPDGVYDGVSGNGDYSCPTVFEVIDGAAMIGKKKVPLNSLRKYLESKPDHLAFH